MTEDPLKSLVVDEGTLARQEVANALRPFVQLTKEGTLWIQPAFDSLPALEKVRCTLLAIKALHLLGFRESDGATPAEVCELTGMAAGTVRPKLSELAKRRAVAKNDGQYSLPPHATRQAVSTLTGLSNGGSNG